MDPVGARGRRPPALRGTPARARRRRPGDRDRPGVGPRLRPGAHDDRGGEADGRAVRREGRLEEDRDVHRGRVALDGGGADGLRGRRRAAAGRRRLRDARPRRRCSSPRRSAGSCGPGSGGRPPRSSCPRCRCCWRTPPRWRSSATTCSGARSPTRTTSSPPRTTCCSRRSRQRTRPARRSCCRSRRSGRRPRFDRVLYDGAEFGHAGEVHVGLRGGDGLPRDPGPARARPGARPAHAPAERAGASSYAGSGGRTEPREVIDPRAARHDAPRAQRSRRRVAPPHRPAARRHPRRPAQGVRRPRSRRRHRQPSSSSASSCCGSGPGAARGCGFTRSGRTSLASVATRAATVSRSRTPPGGLVSRRCRSRRSAPAGRRGGRRAPSSREAISPLVTRSTSPAIDFPS